ncbi:MAG TPA: hypothetical protein VL172_10180, partial [Kofleriaceae bacterium]|nr:hypothetical protein [Kofleriaceae bacterium]
MFTRELIRTAGEPALRRALPSWAALGIGAAVVMGPTGLHPADVVAAIEQGRVVRVVLWAAWIAVSAGPVRELFAAANVAIPTASPEALECL